jgi:hypothetical protein
MLYFLEWVICDDGTFYSNNLSLNYSQFPPTCTTQNQYGFVQETRYRLCDTVSETGYVQPLICTVTADSPSVVQCSMNPELVNQGPWVPGSTIPPPLYYNTIAYSPDFMANFERGVFYYPIITNPYRFGGTYYQIYFQLYMFYISYQICCTPYYYINVPFVLVVQMVSPAPDAPAQSVDFQLTLVYRHPVCPQTCPINYTWTLHKIYTQISSNKYFNQTEYVTINASIQSLINQMNNKKAVDLVPPQLLHYFSMNYNYQFGDNFGMNGSFPSNNGMSLPPNCSTVNI